MLEVEHAGDCWTLTLDRPDAANALSAALVERLHEAMAAAHAKRPAVLVLQGRGRHFCAGFDFTNLEQETDATLLARFVRIELLLQALARLPCLTVALAHGRSFGAGVDLVAACRWRIADPAATFRMPGLAFGIVLGTRRFAALVGRERAREILETLETFDAARAQSLGFVREVVPAERFADTVAQARAAAATLPPAARAALYDTLDDGAHDADLAALVRSAAVPGLRDRMLAYRARAAR